MLGKSASRPLERFTIDSLVGTDGEIRVMRPDLRNVDVHWHDFYELVYVVGGVGQHVVNGVREAIHAGSVFLLTPTDFHAINTVGDQSLSCYNVVIDVQLVDGLLNDVDPDYSGGVPFAVDGWEDAESDFRRLWRESQHPTLGSAELMKSSLACILIELARLRRPSPGLPAPIQIDVGAELRRAIVFVDRHFREQLTLADVAAVAHLSPNYFSEKFREVTGSSFQVYLQERRLRFAHALLGSTALGVTQVCHAAGFNSPSHFGRAYRRRFGESPSAHPSRPQRRSSGHAR